MSHGHNELDVSHAFAAHLLLGHLHTAAVADDAFVTDTLVLTAMALVILDRTKDALAEQSVAFGLIRTIVDGFRL